MITSEPGSPIMPVKETIWAAKKTTAVMKCTASDNEYRSPGDWLNLHSATQKQIIRVSASCWNQASQNNSLIVSALCPFDCTLVLKTRLIYHSRKDRFTCQCFF